MGTSDSDVWQRLVQRYIAYFDSLQEFTSEGVNRVALIKEGIRSEDRWVALKMANYLKPPELMELFDDLVDGASTGHGYVHLFRDYILSLPREWVLERIEDAVEPHLRSGTMDEYRRFLELYLELDHGLTLKLAKRAAEHLDPDIREAGEDFLGILSDNVNEKGS